MFEHLTNKQRRFDLPTANEDFTEIDKVLSQCCWLKSLQLHQRMIEQKLVMQLLLHCSACFIVLAAHIDRA
ncbi:hypothetical protein WJX77_000907 [Trebouxia sp. C0004]